MLPFFNKYPYTNLEQINLDHLFNDVTTMKAEVDEAIEKVNGMEDRVTTAEDDIDALEVRADNLESTVTVHTGAINDLSNDVVDLDGRLDNAESTITEHSSQITSISRDVSTLSGRVTTVEGDINTIAGEVSSLSDEVDDIPVVIANPGGTGSNLNTIGIGGTTYVVPSGGGGGGSSVTPNPTGTPTDDLDTVDIDGTIYAIAGGGTTVVPNPGITPGTTAPDLNNVSIAGDVYKIPTTDISGLQSDVNSLKTRMTTAEGDIDTLEAATEFLSGGIGSFVFDNATNYTSWGDFQNSTNILTLDPGTYLFICKVQVISESVSTLENMEVENILTGFPVLNDFMRAEGFAYMKDGVEVENLMVFPVTITSQASIRLTTNVHRYDYNLNYATIYSYATYFKIR